jgi:hypothetical protein
VSRYHKRALQRLPHVTLLDKDYYATDIRPVMAEWCYLWLQKQHLHGLTKEETIQYLINGAAAKSQAKKRTVVLEAEIQQLKVQMGLASPMVDISPAYEHALGKVTHGNGGGDGGDGGDGGGNSGGLRTPSKVEHLRQQSVEGMEQQKEVWAQQSDTDKAAQECYLNCLTTALDLSVVQSRSIEDMYVLMIHVAQTRVM